MEVLGEELLTLIEKRAEAGEPLYVANTLSSTLVFADLYYGAIPGVSRGNALRLPAGATIDLLRFFEPKTLKASLSLAEAFSKGYLKVVDGPGDIEVEPPLKIPEGLNRMEAPVNIFDEKLAELVEKEREEEQRLLQRSRDALGSRARRKE